MKIFHVRASLHVRVPLHDRALPTVADAVGAIPRNPSVPEKLNGIRRLSPRVIEMASFLLITHGEGESTA